MDKQEINARFEAIEKRLDTLEGKPKKVVANKVQKSKESLPDKVIVLRNEGFFSERKIAREVHNHISTKYPCELNRVEVVLTNLAKKRQLRVTSKEISGKKYRAYVW